MQFQYVGIGPDKALARGTLKVGSEREARALLQSRSIEILMLQKQVEGIFSKEISFGHVSTIDLLFFVKHLGIMLKAGISIFEALQMLEAQSKGRLKFLLKQIVKEVAAGDKLSNALARFPKDFPELIIQLIRTGELSATLEKTLDYIGMFLKKDVELKKRVKGAMLYPIIVLIAVLGLVMGIGLFVLPQLLPLFSSLKVTLPLSTRILLWFAKAFQSYGILIVMGVIGMAIFTPIFLELPWIRPISHRVYLRLPVAGFLIRQVYLARFFRVFATLMGAGIPIDQALDITEKVVGNLAYKKSIRLMKSSVTMGLDLSGAVEKQAFLFPMLATHMLRVGEKSGNLEDSLNYLGEFYEEEVDGRLKNLSGLLEPILLIFIGLLVAGVAFAIIGPIYSLSGGIQ